MATLYDIIVEEMRKGADFNTLKIFYTAAGYTKYKNDSDIKRLFAKIAEKENIDYKGL